MQFAERLRFYRRARKWTQKHLAEQSRTAIEQINRYEKGRVHPSIKTAVRLARALGLSLGDLLGD